METTREKIISLQLSPPKQEEEEGEDEDEVTTPTTPPANMNEDPLAQSNAKRKRSKKKKGKKTTVCLIFLCPSVQDGFSYDVNIWFWWLKIVQRYTKEIANWPSRDHWSLAQDPSGSPLPVEQRSTTFVNHVFCCPWVLSCRKMFNNKLNLPTYLFYLNVSQIFFYRNEYPSSHR